MPYQVWCEKQHHIVTLVPRYPVGYYSYREAVVPYQSGYSGTKPNLVAKILVTKIGNLLALATKIGRQH